MSESIDRRVVEMRFDNKDFEKNVQTTMTVLEKLKEKLNFRGAEKEMGVSGLGAAVDGVRERFSALEVVGMTALVNLTNSAINLGKNLAKSLTIDQVRAGFGEYELKMGSIQTIMASTGKDIGTVNKYLNELNTYSDKTIYSFSDMTNSIGKFTNAGVDLDTAVKAIQGISNEAAVSGANAQEASRAMYNFSQALSAGYVKLIDWKSIENANMATKEFKQQLIDTAVAEGTLEKAADGTYKVLTSGAGGGFKDTITATKNFNDSLSAAWMTSDVLTKTLAKYSDETTEIGKKAFAAAQDVKTFSQLVDTVKEAIGSGWAQTFELIFGNLEEAKKLWTGVNNVISDFVGRSADARNGILETWKASINGRARLLAGFHDLYNAILSVVTPIKEAFREIFPPATADGLIRFSIGFQKLAKSMILSDEAANKLHHIFVVIFRVLKGGLNVVSGVLKAFTSFAKLLLPVGEMIFNVLGNIAMRINAIYFNKAPGKSGNNGILGWLNSLAEAGDKAAEKLGKLTGGVLEKFGSIAGKVGELVGRTFAFVGKALSNLDLAKIGGLLAGGGIFAAGKKLADFIDSITEKLETLGSLLGGGEEGGGIMDSIKETLGALTDTLNQFQESLKVSQLIMIAAALGILAASCATLANIPAKKLAVSVGAIGGLFAELITASRLMKGTNSKGIISMAISIAILAKAVRALSEIENMGKGLAGVGVLLTELTAFCFVFDKLKIKPKAMQKTALGLILMAVAINLLAKPVKELGALDTDQLVQGLIALGVMLGEFAAVSFAFSRIDTKGMVKAGLAMVLMAAAMKLLVEPLTELGSMNLKTLAKGLGAMGAALLELVGFTAVMSLIASSSGNIMKSSAALLVMAMGIKIMANALSQMSSTEGAGKGLGIMFGSLLILSVAMAAMQKSLGGAAAMVIVAGALMIMAPAIALLSSLDIKGVLTGLGALAGTLIIFGVAASVLGPMIPVMIGLAAAMALLGVGVLSLGAGMTLLVAAFSMATGPIIEGATAIAEACPTIAKGIGDGLVAAIKTIGDSAKAVKDSFVKLIDAALVGFTEVIPRLVEVGLDLIQALLDGIDSRIGDITETAISIIVKFINALSEGLPQLTDAGMNLMISFLNSMADTISEKGDQLRNAFMNLILSVLEQLAALIPGFGKQAAAAIEKYRQGLEDGEDSVFDTSSYISDTVDSNLEIPDQYSNGYDAVAGLDSGLNSLVPTLQQTANTIAKIVDDTVRKKNQISSPSRVLMKTGSYLMQGLIKGIDSLTGDYEERADKIATVMIGSATRSARGIADAMNAELSSGFNVDSSMFRAMNVSMSMNGFADQNAELNDKLSRLTDTLDGMTDVMNSRQVNNYNTISSSDPDAFADQLTRRFKLNARTM